MRRLAGFIRLALGLALVGLWLFSGGARAFSDGLPTVALADLPVEARQTLDLIRRGGPFPYPHKDGSVFGNFERRLPPKPRGHYREYTVPTPGSRDRGARRIVAGGEATNPVEYYYTADHYQSFARIRQP